MAETLRERLAGRWVEVLARSGVPAKFLTNRNCACPLCGGTDRFRFTPANGLYICNQCGGGDGVDLLMKFKGWDFKTTADKMEALAAVAKVQKPGNNDTEKLKAIAELWDNSLAIKPDNPAGVYLTKRTGITEYPPCLRFVPRLSYWNGEEKLYFPAMIAKVVDQNGKSVNIYRTYLSAAGSKASVDPPRRMMSGPVPHGSAVRLAPIEGDTLGVGEGVETCISAGLLFDIPVWALLGTGGMQNWVPPVEANKVIICGDNDENYSGQLAAYSLAQRLLTLKNRKLHVEVKIPWHQTIKLDWNDVLMERNRGR